MKISIRLGLFTVIWFAIVFATMVTQSLWMLLAMPLLVLSFCLGATLLAVWCREKERAFYVGFVIFSFGFIFFGQAFKDVGPFTLIDVIIGGMQFGFEETEYIGLPDRYWALMSRLNGNQDYLDYRFATDTTKLGLVPLLGLIGGLFSGAAFDRSRKKKNSQATDNAESSD